MCKSGKSISCLRGAARFWANLRPLIFKGIISTGVKIFTNGVNFYGAVDAARRVSPINAAALKLDCFRGVLKRRFRSINHRALFDGNRCPFPVELLRSSDNFCFETERGGNVYDALSVSLGQINFEAVPHVENGAAAQRDCLLLCASRRRSEGLCSAPLRCSALCREWTPAFLPTPSPSREHTCAWAKASTCRY